jgi:hypothetical protein
VAAWTFGTKAARKTRREAAANNIQIQGDFSIEGVFKNIIVLAHGY